ncbi:hypothetical protein [Mammaliicoccus sciuri]|uniref:hypothetical protein n=1 Tax=Mammaliicoccus sciuri TaxID=1296 RepID=UPI0021CF5EF8|nr:hypothetical protein [Mammaliicoccus sciuri]UXU70136.1 hypothetical protein MUA36_05505 [Mammaliicoccus sciuri]WQL34258.1 hypothetical protein P3U41_05675 [Mammaliicoccus sciuri]WQL61197.1 hypothetical protein P3T96_05675 [Mammaliicoccus sciuri]
MKFTEKEQREIALLNVTHYNDFEEYQKYNNLNKEEFNEQIEKGFIQEITLGTYNGATNTFYKQDITDNHILQAIESEVSESSFKELFFELENEVKDYNDSDWLREYTEVYKVFVIDKDLYVDMD